MFEKLRFRRSHPTPSIPKDPRFAPGWLVKQQRTTLRVLAIGLLGSMGLNGYQVHKREEIAEKPAETFIALVDTDGTIRRVARAENLTNDEFESIAKSEVRRFIYRMRRVGDPDQVAENLALLPYSVTGKAAQKVDDSLRKSPLVDLLRQGITRKLSEKGISVGRRPGENRNIGQMWLTVVWEEEVRDGNRTTLVQRSGEVKIQRFENISASLREFNPLGAMVVDYEFFFTE